MLLDLAARHIVDLGRCNPTRRSAAFAPAPADDERRVLAELHDKAIDGLAPSDTLTTGPEQQFADWRQPLARELVDDAQSHGFTPERWTVATVSGLTVGLARELDL